MFLAPYSVLLRNVLRCHNAVKAGCFAGPRQPRASGNFPYNLFPTRQTATRRYRIRRSDVRSSYSRKRSDVEGRVAASVYLAVVCLPGVFFIPTAWWLFGPYKPLLSPGYLEHQRLDDLRDVVLEAARPVHIGAPKSAHKHCYSLVYKNEIRLLVLHPGESGDDIVFHMEHVTLWTNDRNYEALSYAWGDDKATRDIHAVEGTCAPVTQNLFAALQHLRYQDRIRTLWIDALCIDQEDVDERSHQVQLMGDVFAKADRVVIWLGEECIQSSRAFSSLERIYATSWQSQVWHVTWAKDEGAGHLGKRFVLRTVTDLMLRPYFEEVSWNISETHGLDIDNIDLVSIQALLRRSWFHRLWVIQEVSHASRAVVLCGKTAIPWNTLASALTFFTQNDLTKYLDPVCALACNSVVSIEEMRRRTVREPLFSVMLDNTYGGCRDSRDKIFAMMSISEGRDIFDWEISFDYNLSADELYKRFAIWDVVRNGTFRILSCATATSIDSDLLPPLPTWVPDWTRILDPHLLVRVNATSTFSAGLGRERDVWFTHNKTLMHVEGAIIDSVNMTGSEPPILKLTSLSKIDRATIEQLVAMKDWLSECWNIAKGGRPMAKETYDAFWMTMLCGLDGTGLSAPPIYSKYFRAYFKFMREAPEKLQAILDDTAPVIPYGLMSLNKVLTQAVSIGLLSASLLPDSWEFHSWWNDDLETNSLIEGAVTKWGRSKKFCRTQDGRLARVPTNAAANDSICILHGSEVPYVLRLQEDGTYTVIGECYVHGVMHREALKLPTYELQILRLR